MPFIRATHLNKDAWGEDAEAFRPERWGEGSGIFMPGGTEGDSGNGQCARPTSLRL